MELADLVRPTDAAAADENLWQGYRPPFHPGQPLELAPVGGVHGDVPLVDGDAEAAEDCADGATVGVRTTDAAERGGVDDDGRIAGDDVGVIVGGVLPEGAVAVAGSAVGGVVEGEGSG